MARKLENLSSFDPWIIVHRELGMTAQPGGRTKGLATQGDFIRWEGWQLGMRHHHISQIAEYQRPFIFQDRMVDGAFQRFEHDHHLREVLAGTLMNDELRFSLPFGWLGRLVARWMAGSSRAGWLLLTFRA